MIRLNRRPKSSVLLLPGAIATLLVWAALAEQPLRVNDAALKKAGKHGDVWLTYGLDWAETRYSPLKKINANNVSRLGLAWSYPMFAVFRDQNARKTA